MDNSNNIDVNTSRTIVYQNTKWKETSSLDLRKICCKSDMPSSAKSPKNEPSSIPEESGNSTQHPNTPAVTVVTTKTQTKRDDRFEVCPYRQRCFQCRDLVARICGLLDEIKIIKKIKTPDRICNFCNRSNPTGKCKRCEFLANRYQISGNTKDDARHQRFKIWLCKVKQLLNTILERESSRHKMYYRTPATDELAHLLYELKSSLTVHEPEIGYFPSIDSLENITESKDMLERVLHRLKSDKKSDDYFPHSSGDSNYLIDKKLDAKSTLDEGNELLPEKKGTSSAAEKFTKNLGRAKKSKGTPGPLDFPLGNETKNPKEKSKDYTKSTKDGNKSKEYMKSKEDKKTKDDQKASKDDKGASKDDKEASKDDKRALKDDKKALKDEKGALKDDKRALKDEKGASKDDKKALKDEKGASKDDKRALKDEKGVTKDDKRALRDEKGASKDDKRAIKDDKRASKDKLKKAKGNSENDLMTRMMKELRAKPDVEKPVKSPPERPPPMPKIEDLPIPVRKPREVIEPAISESLAECDTGDDEASDMVIGNDEATEMVIGNRIVPIRPRKGSETGSVQPLLFKVQPESPSIPQEDTPRTTTSTRTATEKAQKGKDKAEVEEKANKGMVRYTLSNKEFIEKGWTLLPTTKIMRRMNIYKMQPAQPKFDWFERHKTQRVVFYDTGEKFAEIQEDGSGKWYYKNGKVALDYYCAKDSSSCSNRYVVYSSGEEKDGGRQLPVTVLATFDYLGNGVVYDHYGNERIKYNQSEGVVIDEKIGPAAKWKWHSLNEPPVLQAVFVDNRLRPTGCLEKHLRGVTEASKKQQDPNLDMLQIELENFLKEKAHKLLQEFKPFQIKMKALRVNDHFSLKVLDQSNIYLMFRDGHTSFKLNLGMLLISNEIVDTDTAEVTQVATPYDRHPPKSESIADIQNALEKAKKLGKARGKLRN